MDSELQIFDKNIIIWYDFKKNSSILQLGDNFEITTVLRKQFNCIVTTNQNDAIGKNFDYVLMYGYENRNEKIDDIKKYLNDDGILLIIGKNDLAINNWSKYNLDVNVGVLDLENHHKRKITIDSIKQELIENELLNINVFFVFPNYKTTEVIINENFKMDKNHIDKYTPDIYKDEIKIFDEIKVLKTLIKINSKETMEIFANSYLIEASKKQIENDVQYVSYNNARKEKYRLITKIRDNVVEKLPIEIESIKHIENMKRNIKEISNQGIQLLDYEENGKIYSKLIKQKQTLDRILASKYNDLDKVTEILNDIREILLKNSIKFNLKIEKSLTQEFDKYKSLLKELNFLENAFWDMVPKNCFLIDNNYVFFDQEWEQKYLPVEFIIYRSVINSYDLVRKIDVEVLLKKLNINKYTEYFNKIDGMLRNEIIDENIVKKLSKKTKSIDNVINDEKMYRENNIKQNEYIKQLEESLKNTKEDNLKKQEYIIALEKQNEQKEQIIKEKSKRKFFNPNI